MFPEIDVVGSFGSRFSYATHSVELARALKRANLLGRCHNLDDDPLDDYTDLWPHLGGFSWDETTPEERQRRDANYASYQRVNGSAAIVIAAPTEAVRALAAAYDVASLFLCPNTNELSREAIETARAFHQVIVPSRYCQKTVLDALGDSADSPIRLELGVHDVFFEGRRVVRERQRRRHARNEPLRLVHFTSDWYWPGRKGTEELIEAWPAIRAHAPHAELVIHAVDVMRDSIYYHCGDRGLFEPEVRVVSSGALRGALPHQLFEAMADADLVVHPSRAEGYGMIALAAVVAGVPLVSTRSSGERDFLDNGAVAYEHIPTVGLSPLHGEDGDAPIVEPADVAAYTIRAIDRLPELRRMAADYVSGAYDARWERRMVGWTEHARYLRQQAAKHRRRRAE